MQVIITGLSKLFISLHISSIYNWFNMPYWFSPFGKNNQLYTEAWFMFKSVVIKIPSYLFWLHRTQVSSSSLKHSLKSQNTVLWIFLRDRSRTVNNSSYCSNELSSFYISRAACIQRTHSC